MHPNSAKNLRMFKPGVSGNPSGRAKKPLPETLRGVDSLTGMEVVKLISKYARMTQDEMAAAVDSKKLSVLELTFVSIFSKSIELGDFSRVSFLLDRCIGKVKDIVEDEDDEYTHEREKLKQLSLSELLELVKAKTNLPESEAC